MFRLVCLAQVLGKEFTVRLATSLADRMLSALVPQKTATAGCGGQFTKTCGSCIYVKQLHGYYQLKQTCIWHDNCRSYTCGACNAVGC